MYFFFSFWWFCFARKLWNFVLIFLGNLKRFSFFLSFGLFSFKGDDVCSKKNYNFSEKLCENMENILKFLNDDWFVSWMCYKVVWLYNNNWTLNVVFFFFLRFTTSIFIIYWTLETKGDYFFIYSFGGATSLRQPNVIYYFFVFINKN